MKISLPLIALAAPLVAADTLSTWRYCDWPFGSCYLRGDWHQGGGFTNYNINADDGCRDMRKQKNPIKYMYHACFDWNPGHIHFYFEGQNKRCLKWDRNTSKEGECQGAAYQKCRRDEWIETECTW